MRVVESVVQVNDNRKRAMGRKVVDALGGDVRGRKVALLGLTFKPNTDDMRDAPSIAIAQALLDGGAILTGYDPEGMEAASEIMPDVTMAKDSYETMVDADAIVIITEWDAFRALDLKRMHELAANPLLIDLRNIYNPDEAKAAGFTYHSIGR